MSSEPTPKKCHFERYGKQFGCGQMIVWDPEDNFYREVESGKFHSKDRCKEYQASHGTGYTPVDQIEKEAPVPAQTNGTKTFDDYQREKAESIKEAQEIRKRENAALIEALQQLTAAIIFHKTEGTTQGVEAALANIKDIADILRKDNDDDE